jgi:EmrB/QacA subfamily drug resistance transporter
MDELRLQQRRWWALAVLSGSLLVISLDNTILNVAIPSLVRSLNASTSQLQWIIDGYTLVFAGLLLTAGALGDRFGRKGALQLGLVIFGFASMASGFAQSSNQLIVARSMMGIGAALIMPSTLSLLTNIFHNPRERAKAIGVWAAVAGASGALGPVIGGLLLKWFSWHAVFFINVPLIIVLLLAGKVLLPKSKAEVAERLDPIGAVLSMVGFVFVLWAVIESPTKGISDPTVVMVFSAGAVAVAAFIIWELRIDHPMLNMRFFKNPRFTAANMAVTLVYFAMFGQMFVMNQYTQVVLGYSPLEAGFRMMPMSIVMICVAPMAPRFVHRIGTKLVVGGGLVVSSIGVLIVSMVPATNGYPILLTGIVVLAFGMGCVMAPATESVMGSLPREKAGVGSAMNDTTRQMGGALGVAVIGSILAAMYRPGVQNAMAAAGISQDLIDTSKESVGGAVLSAAASPGLSPETAAQIQEIAIDQYVNGIHVAMKIGAAVILLAAFVAFKWLPARAGDVRNDVSGPIDGLASLTYAEAEGALEDDQLELEAELRSANDEVRS